jgi:hypothetical protein
LVDGLHEIYELEGVPFILLPLNPFLSSFYAIAYCFPRKTSPRNPRDDSPHSWMASLINILTLTGAPHPKEFEPDTS